jgi:hypothetical protein
VREHAVSEEPDNLILVYLRRMDAKLDSLVDLVADHGRRLTALEIAVANLAATEASHYANLALRVDRVEERLLRTERPLDLVAV